MKSEILPKETIIEVISINKITKEVIKKEMSHLSWLGLNKNEKFTYIPYQKGYSQF
jgi:hypothetical protein